MQQRLNKIFFPLFLVSLLLSISCSALFNTKKNVKNFSLTFQVPHELIFLSGSVPKANRHSLLPTHRHRFCVQITMNKSKLSKDEEKLLTTYFKFPGTKTL